MPEIAPIHITDQYDDIIINPIIDFLHDKIVFYLTYVETKKKIHIFSYWGTGRGFVINLMYI